MELTMHGVRFEIVSEDPNNQMHMTIAAKDDIKGDRLDLSLFFATKDVEQWWALRAALPKADNCLMFREAGTIRIYEESTSYDRDGLIEIAEEEAIKAYEKWRVRAAKQAAKRARMVADEPFKEE